MAAKVWIVLQQRRGELHRMSWEAIAAGQKLAGAVGAGAEAVLLGSGLEAAASQVAEASLDAVLVADDERLADYTPGTYVAVLASAIRQAAPGFVVFPHTYQTVDYMPRLAQVLGTALVPEATAFEDAGEGLVWTRPVLENKLQARVRVKGEGTVLASLQSGAFSADEVERGEAPRRELSFEAGSLEADREILGVEEVGGDQVDLSQAEAIVAAGRGVGGADKMGPLEELARVLGAELGASRPVIDNGWLPRDRQIGSSGQTVAPKLYIAAGISGAIQHLVGMKGSQVIVAINKDPNAPIFTVADYGIVGDLHDVVPALVEAIREAKGS